MREGPEGKGTSLMNEYTLASDYKTKEGKGC